MTSSVYEKIAERLENYDYRREYGAAQIKSSLALLLHEARESKGLSQRELAELMGVTQAYIAKLESGDANPTFGHVGAMLATIRWGVKLALQPLLGEIGSYTVQMRQSHDQGLAHENYLIDKGMRGAVNSGDCKIQTTLGSSALASAAGGN